MIKTFNTPPVGYMFLTEEATGGFYCLGQLYKKHPHYKKFALEQKEKGRFIILDSGIGDHGTPLTNMELFDICTELHPNEVIPLDTLYNKEETIANCEQMHSWLQEANINDVNILMCPQGKDFNEWLECYQWALDHDFVYTIGFSKKTIPHILFNAKPDEMIAESRNMMFDILNYRGLIGKPIHLLGSAGIDEYKHYKGCDWIRSTDSCVAIWAAMNGSTIGMFERIPTPADYFDRTMSVEEISLAIENIRKFNTNVKNTTY